MPKTDLKSLAHPDWPYEGTPHEWRGFVKYTPEQIKKLRERGQTVIADNAETIYQKQNFGDLD